MKPHTHPRHCQRLKAWILASLLLAMGWAWALPLVQPTQLRLVCSGATGAMQLRTLEARHGLQQADAGLGDSVPASADCVLCLSAALQQPTPPPLPLLRQPAWRQPPDAADRPAPPALIEHPPARGPPL